MLGCECYHMRIDTHNAQKSMRTLYDLYVVRHDTNTTTLHWSLAALCCQADREETTGCKREKSYTMPSCIQWTLFSYIGIFQVIPCFIPANISPFVSSMNQEDLMMTFTITALVLSPLWRLELPNNALLIGFDIDVSGVPVSCIVEDNNIKRYMTYNNIGEGSMVQLTGNTYKHM